MVGRRLARPWVRESVRSKLTGRERGRCVEMFFAGLELRNCDARAVFFHDFYDANR